MTGLFRKFSEYLPQLTYEKKPGQGRSKRESDREREKVDRKGFRKGKNTPPLILITQHIAYLFFSQTQ